MADILKVTTPSSGYDNTMIKTPPQAGQGTQIQNPIDPTRVMRGDNRTDAGRNGSSSLLGMVPILVHSQYGKKHAGYVGYIYRYFFREKRC